jgi:acyl-CoA dehydrogenase
MATSPVSGFAAKYYKALARYIAAFALIADIVLATLGGALKRKEYISGRLSDAFAWIFLASAALKDFHDKGQPENQKALLDWTCSHALKEAETALIGVLANLPNRFAAGLACILTFPLGARRKALSDRQINAVAEAMTADMDVRQALSGDIYAPNPNSPGLGALEYAFTRVLEAAPARAKLEQARRDGKLRKDRVSAMVNVALSTDILTKEEATLIEEAETLRDAVIQVSNFNPVSYSELC